jgi:hypothetical protein
VENAEIRCAAGSRADPRQHWSLGDLQGGARKRKRPNHYWQLCGCPCGSPRTHAAASFARLNSAQSLDVVQLLHDIKATDVAKVSTTLAATPIVIWPLESREWRSIKLPAAVRARRQAGWKAERSAAAPKHLPSCMFSGTTNHIRITFNIGLLESQSGY